MRTPVLISLIGLVSSFAIAQSGDIPLTNWTVPPYTHDGLTTMTDATPPRAFVGIAPCRIADTRSGQGFSGQAGPPALSANVTRNFQITGTVVGIPTQCGIPTGAEAVSFQFSVGLPTSAGNFIAWPAGGALPTTSVLNWDGPIGFLGNGTIVPVSAGGTLSVRLNAAAGQTAHLILDVNGYFSDTLDNTANQFEVRSSGGVAIFGENTGSGYGVWGISATGFGVVGGGGAGGVWATTDGTGSGVYGQNTSGFGNGVYGSGGFYGVLGTLPNGLTLSSAGVAGKFLSGSMPAGYLAFRDPFAYYGVYGTTPGDTDGNAGVRGRVQAFSGLLEASGYLGHRTGNATYGVYSQGDYGGSGAKYFVEPHPEKADMVIRYVALEGSESGTYFRGRGKFQNGLATIDVPEDFRLVTDSEGLTVQVTPIGQLATVAVLRMDLNEIVVKSSRNVEFSYTVNGVRKTHKHLTPIGPGHEFMPESPDAKMPLYLTEGQREMLISNGTYNADGTVNMETARRLGWDKEWEKRARPAPQPQ